MSALPTSSRDGRSASFGRRRPVLPNHAKLRHGEGEQEEQVQHASSAAPPPPTRRRRATRGVMIPSRFPTLPGKSWGRLPTRALPGPRPLSACPPLSLFRAAAQRSPLLQLCACPAPSGAEAPSTLTEHRPSAPPLNRPSAPPPEVPKVGSSREPPGLDKLLEVTTKTFTSQSAALVNTWQCMCRPLAPAPLPSACLWPLHGEPRYARPRG